MEMQLTANSTTTLTLPSLPSTWAQLAQSEIHYKHKVRTDPPKAESWRFTAQPSDLKHTKSNYLEDVNL